MPTTHVDPESSLQSVIDALNSFFVNGDFERAYDAKDPTPLSDLAHACDDLIDKINACRRSDVEPFASALKELIRRPAA